MPHWMQSYSTLGLPMSLIKLSPFTIHPESQSSMMLFLRLFTRKISTVHHKRCLMKPWSHSVEEVYCENSMSIMAAAIDVNVTETMKATLRLHLQSSASEGNMIPLSHHPCLWI